MTPVWLWSIRYTTQSLKVSCSDMCKTANKEGKRRLYMTSWMSHTLQHRVQINALLFLHFYNFPLMPPKKSCSHNLHNLQEAKDTAHVHVRTQVLSNKTMFNKSFNFWPALNWLHSWTRWSLVVPSNWNYLFFCSIPFHSMGHTSHRPQGRQGWAQSSWGLDITAAVD